MALTATLTPGLTFSNPLTIAKLNQVWTNGYITLSGAANEAQIENQAVTAAKLAAAVAGDGLVGANGSPLAVNPDGSTIEISGGAVQLKDGGTTAAKLAATLDLSGKTVTLPAASVTKEMIENVADMKLLGNVSGSAAAPAEVSILKSTDGDSASDIAVATEKRMQLYSRKNYLKAVDNKTSGTSPQSLVSGWNDRNLLTLLNSSIVGASLVSNAIGLPAGSYDLSAFAMINNYNGGPGFSQLRILATEDGVSRTAIVGNSVGHWSSWEISLPVLVSGRITLTGNVNSIKLQHYVKSTVSGGSVISSGENEIYAQVEIWKVG